jgi:hypothetical protein
MRCSSATHPECPILARYANEPDRQIWRASVRRSAICRQPLPVQVTQQRDLGPVMHLFIDKRREHSTRRPLDTELSRSQLVEPIDSHGRERRSNRALAR